MGAGARLIRMAVVACVLAAAGPSAAQLPGNLPIGRLPDLPPLPRPSVPVDIIGDVPGLAQSLDPRRLADLRALRLRDLIRANPRDLEADDDGQPVVRGEILAVAPSAPALTAVRSAGFGVLREERLDGLDIQLVTLRAPAGLSARAAIRRLRRIDPRGQYEFNHLYFNAGAAQQPAPRSVGAGGTDALVRVGLIDTGVDISHPALAGLTIEQQGFAPGGVRAAGHGTAVASLIAGRSPVFRGAAPGASLQVADVYGAGPRGGSAEAVVRAMDWMGRSRTPVVNVSLVGPANALVQSAVAGLVQRGVLVVAAVGNDGPAAPPAYPAAYPGVVAVTGVDARGRVLPEAGRAARIDFAAPGADMVAADEHAGYAVVRGTSFAAPIVAGRLARFAAAGGAVEALSREAQDVGVKGPDKVYGRGLVGADVRIAPTTIGAAR